MEKVLFVCVGNSGRSQMAEAFFNILAEGKAEASSSGTNPAVSVDPQVVQVMREVGIDISDKKPKKMTLEMAESSDRVVTMGCGVENTCPATFMPTKDWGLQDPKGQSMDKVREIRDEIKRRVEELVAEITK